jgi:hypothetical protein
VRLVASHGGRPVPPVAAGARGDEVSWRRAVTRSGGREFWVPASVTAVVAPSHLKTEVLPCGSVAVAVTTSAAPMFAVVAENVARERKWIQA